MNQVFIKPNNMKKIINSGIIAALLLVSVGCNNSENEVTENTTEITDVAPENLVVVDYAVESMVCAMGCAKTIQDEVADMSGVVVCDVDYEAEKAHIEFDKSQLSEKEIVAKIESLADGQYKVGEWEDEDEDEEVIEDEEAPVEEVQDTENTESVIEVSLPTFEIPNLFTYLLERI